MPDIKITDNQMKVIKDKYLKDGKDIEQWLEDVSVNISLSEFLYHPEYKEEIFKDIKYTEVTKDIYDNKITYCLLHNGLTYNERNDNFKKFINNLNSLNERYPSVCTSWAMKFYNLMSQWKFLPNSPTLMNASRDIQMLSACFVLEINDSIEGWMKTAHDAAIIHKMAGGTGFDFSNIRPKGDIVQSTYGVASGPISPMKIINNTTNEIKAGSLRRGANMATLSVYHPDILEFIELKSQEGVLENFNISVTVDNNFMEKLYKNEEIKLINPRDKKVVKTIQAKYIWDKIIHFAWESGDPGIIFIEKANNSKSNPVPSIEIIKTTNPCSEIIMGSNDACNLSSINVYKYFNNKLNDLDYKELEEDIPIIVRFMDNVIDVNNYPLPEIEEKVKQMRRIGIGIMGFAELLIKLHIPYGSKESFSFASNLMNFIQKHIDKSSEDLANERGVFPLFKDSIYDQLGKYHKFKLYPRHSARTAQAPTGTISIAAGLQGSGIEPFFAIVYNRYNAAGIDELKKGITPSEKNTFFEVNTLFKEEAIKNNFFGLIEKELYRKISENNGSVKGIGLSKEIEELFVCAHDLTPEQHVLIQAAFQKYIDNGISKTVNFSNSATIENIDKVYRLAYENDCKSVTVFRDGCKSVQVLNTLKNKTEPKAVKPRSRPKQTRGITERLMTSDGNLYVTINEDTEGPCEVFIHIGKHGTDILAWAEAVGRLISLGLRSGVDVTEISEQLIGITNRPIINNGSTVLSVPDGIGQILRRLKSNPDELKSGNTIKNNVLNSFTKPCPVCGSPLIPQEGCEKCVSCNYSRCG